MYKGVYVHVCIMEEIWGLKVGEKCLYGVWECFWVLGRWIIDLELK